LTAKRLQALGDLLTDQAIVHWVLAGPCLEASRVMEGSDATCGEISWLLQRAYETMFSWRDDLSALGLVVGEGDIEAVRASSIQRFYCSSGLLPRPLSRSISMLGSGLTLTGCNMDAGAFRIDRPAV
jgi:hypothetical protein